MLNSVVRPSVEANIHVGKFPTLFAFSKKKKSNSVIYGKLKNIYIVEKR